jgi:diguanylate cyclase (GGDEF)-like protein
MSCPSASRWTRAVVVGLLGWVTAGPVLAEEWIGEPSIEHFGPVDTGASPYSYAILPMASGEVWVGNGEGLLRYFGRRWQLIELPGLGAARSLDRGADGRIYVGGYQHFGYIERSPEGEHAFHGLDERVQPDATGAPLGEIWDTVATRSGVYFSTRERVFYFRYQGQIETIDLPGPLLSIFAQGEAPVAALRDGRLFRLQGARLEPWLDIGGRVRGLVPDAAGRLLALTEDGRLHRLGERAAVRVSHAAEAALASRVPYAMSPLPEGGYAIATLSGELVKLDEDGRRFSVHRVSDAPLIGLAVDGENHLWISSEGGIARMSLAEAWSLFDAGHGLRGPVMHAAMHEGRLYVATSVGLYGARKGEGGRVSFELIGLGNQEVHHLLSTRSGLLVAWREGVQRLRGRRLENVLGGTIAWRLVASRFPGRVYVIEDSGLAVLAMSAAGTVVEQRFLDPSYRFDQLVEEAEGAVWTDRLLADPMRFPLDVASSKLADPLPMALGTLRGEDDNAGLLALDGSILVSTDDALLEWSGSEFRVLSAHPLISAGLAPSTLLKTRQCIDGSVYAFTDRRLLRRAAGSGMSWVELSPMDGGVRGVNEVVCGEGGAPSWIATWDGLVRLDPERLRETTLPRAPALERIEAVFDDRARALPLAPGPSELVGARRLRFEFASPDLSGQPRYQSRLRGYEQQWSAASSLGVREFGALPAGTYEFQARVVDERGRTGPSTHYAFRVPKAWYETVLGRIGLTAALVALLAALVRWRSAALERRTRELEQTVAERTEALAQRSRELERANLRLSQLADLDGLTGVANRRKLEAELARAWELAQAGDAPLALLLIDVDHFKRFNDAYGHLLGDERLRAISARLARFAGPGELLARFGGEEFVLLLPGASLEAASERAEAIRRDAAEIRPGEADATTVSIGWRPTGPESGLRRRVRCARPHRPQRRPAPARAAAAPPCAAGRTRSGG